MKLRAQKDFKKLLISNTYTCLYILNFHVCIKLHGYVDRAHIMFTVLHTEVPRIFVKGFEKLGIKKVVVGTSNSLGYAILRY